MAEEEEVLVPQGKTEEEEEQMESPEEREPVDRIKFREQDQEEAQLSSSGCPSGTKQQHPTLTCSPQVNRMSLPTQPTVTRI